MKVILGVSYFYKYISIEKVNLYISSDSIQSCLQEFCPRKEIIFFCGV